MPEGIQAREGLPTGPRMSHSAKQKLRHLVNSNKKEVEVVAGKEVEVIEGCWEPKKS